MGETLLNQWRNRAFDLNKKQQETQKFWDKFSQDEKKCYIKLFEINKSPIIGTVEYFSKLFNVDYITFIGFLDGINDSLKIPNNLEELKIDSSVILDYNKDILYENMLNANYDMSIWGDYKSTLSPQEQAYNNEMAREALNKPKCPTCGSTNISKISTLNRMFSVGMFGLASGKIGKTHKCNNCGYIW